MKTMLWASLVFAVFNLISVPAGAKAASPQVCDDLWHDAARDRVIPVRIRLPAGAGMVPVILFSHGLGGNLDAGTIWGDAWAADGNAVIHLQHVGSDSSVIGAGGLRRAMSIEQLRARVLDVKFAIDEIGRGPVEGVCDLSRLDLGRIGMAGHSFGAQTTLAVAGQTFHFTQLSLADARIRAAVALSPQPSFTQSDEVAFSSITIPFFSITGTKDTLAWLPQVRASDRERPHRAMAPGQKYLLVMEGGNHRMFSGQDNITLPDRKALTHVHKVVARATTLFWRTTLRDDRFAVGQLSDLGATLHKGDRFEAR